MQRFIVEHVVKSSDLRSDLHSVKLRTFSGRVPCPNTEVDYDTWRDSVEFYLADPAVPKGQLVRKIVDSLLAPAATIVKSLGPYVSPRAYLNLLDSAYDIVKDGDDLFAEFLNINQNSGEKPSSYLHRLQTALNKIVKAKAVSPTDSDRQLLKQFCRGCWNNTLISTLQLEKQKEKPPTFSELLWLLRTEEDKQTAKANRMKQHLGFTKTKAQVQAQNLCEPDIEYDLPPPVETPPSAMKQLQKQIAELQAQVAALSYPKDKPPNKPQAGKKKLKLTTKEPNANSLEFADFFVLVCCDCLYAGETLEAVLRGCAACIVSNTGERIGITGRHEPSIIPAGQKVVLEGFVSGSEANNERWAVLEEPLISSLPGGIFIDSCLISIPACSPYKVPVVLRNETSHDIVLPSNSVLAELCIPHEISQTYNTCSPSQLSSSAVCSSQQQSCHDEQQSDSLSFDFGDSPLPVKWEKRITQTLNTYSDMFSQHDFDFGHATKVKHRIKLRYETPFKHRPRPIHPKDYDAVRRHLQTLLEAGIIRESESPYASPIVVVKKKNGDVRLCVDYRRLNMQTIKDAYALPNLEESFSALSGSHWFSVMDLKSGYYQIEMHEDDKPKTAFVCPLGFWEWNRMPQGITNAPSTFQRLMEKCMGDIHLREVLVFLDDIIVFSQTLEEHEARLTKVLDRLRENGLKLSPEKCRFFQTSVRYLGHIVSQKGVEIDPQKIEALKTWPRPRTLKELRSFLGFSGYYRRFVQDYSKIVKPLTNLTAGYPPARKSAQKTKTDVKYFHPKEPFGERWTTACQNAFERIIERLTSSPVLGFANPELPYVLHTDASTTGLGAALYQEQDGQKRYRAGKQNQDADGLSRRPHGPLVNDNCSQEESLRIHQFTSHHLTPVDVVKATCQYHAVVNEESPSHCLVESLAIHPDTIPPVYEDVESELQGLCSVPMHSEGEIARLQREDPSISVIIKALESGEPAPQQDVQSPELILMLREMSRLEVKNSLLYRKRQCEDRTEYQLVLPRVLRPPVLTSLHDEMGHLGIERTLELTRSRFYWPKMSADVESKVKTCPRCVKSKHQPEKAALMVSIQTS
ncbi:hypothetical protein MHYP_G00161490 [Metynnis hypsauchen]